MIPKYKAYDLVENEWISIRTIGLGDNGEFWYLQAWDECENDIDPPYFEDDLGKSWILLQFTGLKDKNGVEIFEGDILEDPYERRSIEMYHGAWVARDVKDKVLGEIDIIVAILRGAKVIGNIYENEDLLEGDNE